MICLCDFLGGHIFEDLDYETFYKTRIQISKQGPKIMYALVCDIHFHIFKYVCLKVHKYDDRTCIIFRSQIGMYIVLKLIMYGAKLILNVHNTYFRKICSRHLHTAKIV